MSATTIAAVVAVIAAAVLVVAAMTPLRRRLRPPLGRQPMLKEFGGPEGHHVRLLADSRVEHAIFLDRCWATENISEFPAALPVATEDFLHLAMINYGVPFDDLVEAPVHTIESGDDLPRLR